MQREANRRGLQLDSPWRPPPSTFCAWVPRSASANNAVLRGFEVRISPLDPCACGVQVKSLPVACPSQTRFGTGGCWPRAKANRVDQIASLYGPSGMALDHGQWRGMADVHASLPSGMKRWILALDLPLRRGHPATPGEVADVDACLLFRRTRTSCTTRAILAFAR